MKYIVLDLEYNQAFDFGDGHNKLSNARCPFEIIQIGAVRLNSNFKYEASLNLLIKPVIYKRIHPYVARITGLDYDVLKNKQSFAEALSELYKFVGKKQAIYCVWGANDIKELRKNMDYYSLSNDKANINFIDVQGIASRYLNHLAGMGIGLKKAVAALDIEMDRPFHDALNDAEYTAKILQLLRREPLKIMQFTHDRKTMIVPPSTKADILTFYNSVKDRMTRTFAERDNWMFKNVYLGTKAKSFDDTSKEKIK